LGRPSLDGFQRREAIERVIDLKSIKVRCVMRVLLPRPFEGVKFLGSGGADVPVPIRATGAAENKAAGREGWGVNGEDEGSSSSGGSSSGCRDGSGGRRKDASLL
jgi:hypothetical protein